MNKEFFENTDFKGDKFPKCPYTFRHEDGEVKQHRCRECCPYFIKIQDDGKGYCNFENATLVASIVGGLTELVKVVQKFQTPEKK